jgi:hypothetical protein
MRSYFVLGLTSLIFAGGLVALLVSSAASARTPPAESKVSTPWSGVPPTDIWAPNSSVGWGHATQTASGTPVLTIAEPQVVEKQVSFRWTLVPPDPITTAWIESDGVASELRRIATRYWPTQVFAVGSDVWYVAGKDARDDTVLERWSFTPPEVVYPVGGGVPTITPGDRNAVAVVKTWNDADRDMIQRVWAKHNDTSEALVQFWGSRNVHWIDLLDGSDMIAVASSGPASVPVEPTLADWMPFTFGPKQHVTAGVVYFLTQGSVKEGFSPHTGSIPFLLMLDGDSNGSIDSTLPLSAADYESQGWGDPANYL